MLYDVCRPRNAYHVMREGLMGGARLNDVIARNVGVFARVRECAVYACLYVSTSCMYVVSERSSGEREGEREIGDGATDVVTLRVEGKRERES